MDVDDSTVEYYAKQGFFHATNQNDLRVHLQTALDMLELLICKNSIATEGMHYILDPPRWRRFTTILHGRFAKDKSFGTKFLYSVDRTLQVFFDRMTNFGDSTEPNHDDDLANLLISEAKALMYTVEYGEALAIELPAHLLQGGNTAPRTKDGPQKVAKKAKVPSPSATARASRGGGGYQHSGEEHKNLFPHPSWLLVGTGVNYLSLFPDRSPKTKNWPKLLDARFPKRNGQTRSAPLCVR